MPQRTSPHENAKATARDQTEYAYLTSGIVTSTVSTQQGPPAVIVQEGRVPADEPIPVLPTVHGDYYLPAEGTTVLVAKVGRDQPVVVGGAVPNVETPQLSGGERIVSHPASTSSVRFNEDGSLDVNGDGGGAVTFETDGTVAIDGASQVVVNGGTDGVITDVTTEKDADGHVTSIQLVRNGDVLV